MLAQCAYQCIGPFLPLILNLKTPFEQPVFCTSYGSSACTFRSSCRARGCTGPAIRFTCMIKNGDQSCRPNTLIGETNPQPQLHHRFPKLETVVYAPALYFENTRQLQPHVHSHGGVPPLEIGPHQPK